MKMLKKAMNNERTAGIIFTMPFTIGFLLFMIVPMGISLYYPSAAMIFCLRLFSRACRISKPCLQMKRSINPLRLPSSLHLCLCRCVFYLR